MEAENSLLRPAATCTTLRTSVFGEITHPPCTPTSRAAPSRERPRSTLLAQDGITLNSFPLCSKEVPLSSKPENFPLLPALGTPALNTLETGSWDVTVGNPWPFPPMEATESPKD